MFLARVVGRVVATAKDPQLAGLKLLLLQPFGEDGQPSGAPLVAVDSIGAGAGETVIWVRSREASFPFWPRIVPVDAAITAIVDSLDGRPVEEGAGRG